jgi:hypothetical protein
MKRLLVVLLAVLAGCTSAPPGRKRQPVEGNVTFRLSRTAEGVELRLESSFYPTSGYELATHFEDASTTPSIDSGVTLFIDAVLVPEQERGSRAPASTLIILPFGKNVEGVKWPLRLKLPIGTDSVRTDSYLVTYTPGGWRVEPNTGGFSHFQSQGSY